MYRFGTPGARPKIYLHAGLHAQELPGMVVLNRLVTTLQIANGENRIRGEIVVVPCANPIGLAQQIYSESLGRYDLDTMRNFNRGFPDLLADVSDNLRGRLGSGLETNIACVRQAIRDCLGSRIDLRESDALKTIVMQLSCDADHVVDVHSASEAILHMFVTRPVSDAMQSLAKNLRVPLVLVDEGNAMMTFKSAHALLWRKLALRFRKHPLPVAASIGVVELRGQRDVDECNTVDDSAGLYNWICELGAVVDTPGDVDTHTTRYCDVANLTRLHAEQGGIVVFRQAVGARLEKGDVIADILDPVSRKVLTVTAPVSGCLFTRKGHRFVRKDQYYGAIAGDG